jgi:aminoglycoside/choline kinase family phosphotransferase
MRIGPAVYDLASVLYDPYVSLSDSQREAYLSVYLESLDANASKHIPDMLPIAGIQRLVQALGAFGRLGGHPETKRFEKHIPVARDVLMKLLTSTRLCPSLFSLLSEQVSR